jgi:hypothetical protein
MARLIVAALLLAAAAPAFAQDEFGDGRIRHLDSGVLLQRAGESEAEEALVNMPFLPGDRLWSDDTGRVELQFEGAALLRLDSRGKLDYLSHDEGRRNDRIALRLWSGGVYFHVRDGRVMPDFELETPGGMVELLERGVYRVDVEAGETRLSVFEGEAALDSGGRRIRVEAGERTYASRGEEPERPAPFDRYEDDEFARWDREREERTAVAVDSERYLPEEIGHYGGELESAGSWYYESEVGHVWRPYVSAGWRPYTDGHWTWSAYGWTWVPYEPWGWATSHYGRWGVSPVLGWYWIPGQVWGPAWVSWAVGGDFVGWCPLGYRDRPVVIAERARPHAVPRGSVGRAAAATSVAAAAGEGDSLAAFHFVRKADMGSRRLGERRFAVQGRDAAQVVRVAESPRALTRELRLSEGTGAVASRAVKTRPTFGDTVPELRGDPATTIPLPMPGRRERVDGPAGRSYSERPQPGSRPTDLRSPREPEAAPRSRTSPERGVHPTDQRSPRWEVTQPQERNASPRGVQRSEPQAARPSPWNSRVAPQERGIGERETPARREPEQDVVRRFFQPANEGRSRGEGGQGSSSQGSVQRSQPRPAAPQRAEPRRSAPQPPASAPPQRAKPKKEKD